MLLVKILKHDDLEIEEIPKWHLVESFGDAERTVCTGEVFRSWDAHVEYKDKIVKKGGITCPECLKIIKWYKQIKL